MSRVFDQTRTERANRLREPIRSLVKQSSLRQASKITGCAVGPIRSLLEGRTPREDALAALEIWAGTRKELRNGTEAGGGSTGGPRPRWLDPRVIGSRIKSIREEVGLTQEEFAEKLGKTNSQALVSRWERGVIKAGYDDLADIADLVGAGVEIFQTADGNTPSGTAGFEEETPEQAVGQTELEAELDRVLGVVRLVDGKEEFTHEQRQGLKRDILGTYIDAFKEYGMDTRELYVMYAKVDRGEL